MKFAVRLAVVLVAAATSAAALAVGDPTSGVSPGEPQNPHSYELNTTAKTASDRSDLGHGSGEPERSAAQIKADESAETAAALRDQRQKDFLKEVWSPTP